MNPNNRTDRMTTNAWQKLASLPEGGMISGISSTSGITREDSGDLWLCSPDGLFLQRQQVFSHQMRGIPFSSASAVLAFDKTTLVAGYPNHIIRSADGGSNWIQSWVEQVNSPITCFAVSMNAAEQKTLLAGSDGDGVLRSTDGGKSWQLSNFGLRSFNVLDLSVAPIMISAPPSNAAAIQFEFVYAATEQGVYQSPNGGRAWRYAGEGLPPVPILAIAVSPDFKFNLAIFSSFLTDHNTANAPFEPTLATHEQSRFCGGIFAGSDGAGLFRSLDGGKSWHPVTTLPGSGMDWSQATINTLFFDSQGTLFVGTGEGAILSSPDLGETWQRLTELDDTILKLSGRGNQLFAGTADHGLLVSNDGGKTWQTAPTISARYTSQFACLPQRRTLPHRPITTTTHTTAADPHPKESFLVAGYHGGLWTDTRGEWSRISQAAGWPAEQPVLALQSSHSRLLALTPHRLLVSTEPDHSWEVLFESPHPLGILTCAGEEILLGAVNGEIWRSPNGGKTWNQISTPLRKARLLTLKLDLRSGTSPRIYAAARLEEEAALTLWRCDLSGANWKRLLQERASWQSAHLALFPIQKGEGQDPGILFASGTELFRYDGNGWSRQTISTPEALVTGLWVLAEKQISLLARPAELLLSYDLGATWEPAGMEGFNVTALKETFGDSQRVYALTSTGAIYQRVF